MAQRDRSEGTDSARTAKDLGVGPGRAADSSAPFGPCQGARRRRTLGLGSDAARAADYLAVADFSRTLRSDPAASGAALAVTSLRDAECRGRVSPCQPPIPRVACLRPGAPCSRVSAAWSHGLGSRRGARAAGAPPIRSAAGRPSLSDTVYNPREPPRIPVVAPGGDELGQSG